MEKENKPFCISRISRNHNVVGLLKEFAGSGTVVGLSCATANYVNEIDRTMKKSALTASVKSVEILLRVRVESVIIEMTTMSESPISSFGMSKESRYINEVICISFMQCYQHRMITAIHALQENFNVVQRLAVMESVPIWMQEC